jgi:hypothetical protein
MTPLARVLLFSMSSVIQSPGSATAPTYQPPGWLGDTLSTIPCATHCPNSNASTTKYSMGRSQSLEGPL